MLFLPQDAATRQDCLHLDLLLADSVKLSRLNSIAC